MDIQLGDYLQRIITKTYTTKEGEEKTEERKEYYFVLDVTENGLEVMENRTQNAQYYSSPRLGAVVYEYEDVAKEYTITIIPAKEIKDEQIYVDYKRNGLDCQRLIGCKRRWHEKELCIEYDKRYYNGSEFVYPPAGLYNEEGA